MTADKKTSKDRAREIVEDAGVEVKEGRGPSQASQLQALARERYDLFMSEDGRPYGVKKDGPNTVYALRGQAGLRSHLAGMYTDANGGSVPSQSALADAMTVLEGVAADAEPRQLHIRVARHDERIVVDLATPEGRCVSIGADGWHREASSPVLFRRSGAMKPLPEPIRDGDGLAKLQDLLNTDEEGFHLLVAWLVACFIPDLPHPILTFRGEQGTGKSYAAKMVIGIVDPSGAPKRTAPRDIKAWATQAFNSWALCLDNVSIIADWLSDALCRAVTGDGIVDRALYTDDDVVVLEFRRVLAMTTIDAGALAGDLAERLVTIELHTIPDAKRREENEMDEAYAEAHASILASLFDLLAEVLKVLPDVVLTERPRMADFARILAAVDKVKGWDTMASYKASARDAVADVLDGEPFAQAVVAMVDKAPAEGLTLTTQQILDTVETPDKPPKKWPKDSTRAGGQLKRLAPALRTIGIEVDDSQRGPAPKRQRLYKLTATAERRSAAASTASSAGGKGPLTSADGVDASEPLAASTPRPGMDVVDAELFAASPPPPPPPPPPPTNRLTCMNGTAWTLGTLWTLKCTPSLMYAHRRRARSATSLSGTPSAPRTAADAGLRHEALLRVVCAPVEAWPHRGLPRRLWGPPVPSQVVVPLVASAPVPGTIPGLHRQPAERGYDSKENDMKEIVDTHVRSNLPPAAQVFAGLAKGAGMELVDVCRMFAAGRLADVVQLYEERKAAQQPLSGKQAQQRLAARAAGEPGLTPTQANARRRVELLMRRRDAM